MILKKPDAYLRPSSPANAGEADQGPRFTRELTFPVVTSRMRDCCRTDDDEEDDLHSLTRSLSPALLNMPIRTFLTGRDGRS